MESRMGFASEGAFERWIKRRGPSSEGVWIEFYKDGSPGISYGEALEVALRHGWIDSLLKRVDDRIYIRKFSPRKKNSRWSETNKRLALDLIARGEMAEGGLAAVEEARRNGQWDRGDERDALVDVDGLRSVLELRGADLAVFDGLTSALKEHYSMVYFAAKRPETREKRLAQIAEYAKSRKRFL